MMLRVNESSGRGEKVNETIYYNVSDMKMFTFTSPTSLFASLADDFVCFT